MHWETRKTHVTCFIVILALLRWSGTKPTISPRYACKHTSINTVVVSAVFAEDLFWILISRLTFAVR